MIDKLLAVAQESGTPIDGADGLLNQMTKAVIERALQGEMTHQLGYEYDDPAGVGSGNSRNGTSEKTVSTTNGPVTIRVPRDRNGEVEPQIVPTRARRVGQVDELVLSCYARGMSARDIESHLWEVYGVEASRELISNITDVVTDDGGRGLPRSRLGPARRSCGWRCDLLPGRAGAPAWTAFCRSGPASIGSRPSIPASPSWR